MRANRVASIMVVWMSKKVPRGEEADPSLCRRGGLQEAVGTHKGEAREAYGALSYKVEEAPRH
jgi:hypothetical protein